MRGGKVALDGYCAVCLLEMKDWVAGSPQHQVAYDGMVYRFPDAPKAAMFRADPVRYAPALGGDDIVEYARTGKRTAGKTAFGAKYLDRHYFFASDANKQAFTANPIAYSDADLALGGACVVCQVDLRQNRPGSPQFVSLHKGMRFRFAGPQQQQAFEAQPDRYTAALPAGSGMKAGSGSAPGAGSGSGGF